MSGQRELGHATISDLVHWTDQTLPITSENETRAFTGICYYDFEDTSGLGTASPPYLAWYKGYFPSQ
ncbi:hypothetical protein GB937_009610 [Aspergillus fischeri]|nr:hypothetical protein GB937_009610 [Aspergillus fischeri]